MNNKFEREMLKEFEKIKVDISERSSEILKVSENLILENIDDKFSLKNIESILNDRDKNSLSWLYEVVKSLSDYKEMIKVNVEFLFSKMSEISMNSKKFSKISESIFVLLKEKEKLVKKNLEKVAEVAVVLSLEIQDYLKLQDMVDFLNNLDVNEPNDFPTIKMMQSYIIIAFDNIEKLIELNHYMVEIFDSNVVNEEQSVELVEMNSHCAKNLKVESNRIFDFTLSERELINKNLQNSSIIRKNIEKIMESIS